MLPPPMRALVLVPVLAVDRVQRPDGAGGHRPAPVPRANADRLDEAVGLAQAIDLDVAGGLIVPVPQPRPSTLFGSGKVEEIKTEIAERETGLVIVDHAISPVQQRNLERAWNVKVIDRTGLILEIFGRRARTREGRLQVELAHLSYQKSRLVRSWTHLERQRGGGGFLGGPGERQLELDRRMLQDRIDAIKKELAGVVRTRALHRAGRAKVPYPVVAIVGYTNAGKSTLFNRITGAGVMAKDQVFATLDPTMREVALPSGRRIILSDTVGFISNLPTTLVAAFRATLEEVVGADLIAHVRDISRSDTDAQARDVEGVLHDLGIDPQAAGSPVIEVWNKIDRLDPEAREELRNEAARCDRSCVVTSAATGEGLPALLAAIDARLGGRDNDLHLVVEPDQGRLLSWIHANAQVLDQASGDDGHIDLHVRIAAEKRGQLERQMKLAARNKPAGRAH